MNLTIMKSCQLCQLTEFHNRSYESDGIAVHLDVIDEDTVYNIYVPNRNKTSGVY